MQRRSRWHFGGRGLFLIDGLIGFLVIAFGYWVAPDLSLSWSPSFPGQPAAWPTAIGFALLYATVADVCGLHDPLRQKRFWPVTLRLLVAVLAALLIVVLALYVLALQQLGRQVFAQSFVIVLGSSLAARWLMWRVEERSGKVILPLLKDTDREALADRIDRTGLPLRVLDLPESYGPNITASRLRDVCAKFGVDEVIVDSSLSRRNELPVWMDCLHEGIQVTDFNLFMERYFYRVNIAQLDVDWFLSLDLRLTHPIYHRWKRFTDILLSVIGILVSAPIVALVSLALLIESGRPVFFRQERVGLRNRVFTIWKLRTMADERSSSVRPEGGYDRERITRIGHILRRTRFDELPQFWNILKGEMSFIGPRPEWVDIAKRWDYEMPMYSYRTLVKPGLTGWAQINYAYAVTEEDVREKLSYDFYYMKHASVLLDVQIILRTIGAMMKGSR